MNPHDLAEVVLTVIAACVVFLVVGIGVSALCDWLDRRHHHGS